MTGRKIPSTKGEGMWSASRTPFSPARGTHPASLRRRRNREAAPYPSRAAVPASHTAAGRVRQSGAGPSRLTAGARFSSGEPPVAAG